MFLKIFPSFTMTMKFFAGSSISLMLAIGSPSTSRTFCNMPSMIDWIAGAHHNDRDRHRRLRQQARPW